jgi:hypothetical protein
MKHITIKAEIQNLDKKEILEMVPADTIARIKETDAKPVFKVYSVGHEGTANAQELSFGQKLSKAYHYVKNAVLSLAEKLQFGTPIFRNHADTNEHAGREQVGELVGKAVKIIGNKLSALAVTYIYPQYRKLPLDVASIEGEVEYYARGNNGGEVIDVQKITGIALGNSEEVSPAFPGATLQGVLQAFAKNNRPAEGKMEKQEIIDAIREGKFTITDIFTADEIVSSEPVLKAKQKEYEHAKRVEKQLAEERERMIDVTKERDEAQGKIKTLNEQVSQTRTKDLFTKANETRKFNDKQKGFIERRLGAFKSEKSGEELQLEFERYLDGEIKEFGEYAKVMGIKEETDPNKDKGAGADDGTDGDGKDMSDPKNNDLIPQG